MDTISRESSTSYLPVAGVILGAIGLILGAAGFFKANSLGKRVPEDMLDQLAKISAASDEARSAMAAADKANAAIGSLTSSTQKAVDAIFGEIAAVKSTVVKMEEAGRAKPAAAKKPAESAVAGPGEYIVQPGDTGYKIASKLGVPFNTLQEANPTVDWNHMRPGQKLKVPGK